MFGEGRSGEWAGSLAECRIQLSTLPTVFQCTYDQVDEVLAEGVRPDDTRCANPNPQPLTPKHSVRQP